LPVTIQLSLNIVAPEKHILLVSVLIAYASKSRQKEEKASLTRNLAASEVDSSAFA
jgi:hypothetical protein